ncbi:hypothetical protein OAT84_03015 [Gammaproteobacteria bacterium]|nr:hypothetical protein [Gammaproteobacteria bacterium]
MSNAIDHLFKTILPDENGQFSNQFFELKHIGFYLKRHPELQQSFFQQLTTHLCDIPNRNIEHKQATIKHLLNFIPLAITHEDEITLPIEQADGGFKFVDYKIEKFPLTSKLLPSSHQYYALALSADQQPSQLIFMGTAPLSVQGSMTTVLADLFPLKSIGWLLSFKSKSLLAWSKKQSTIHATGLSLGGAVTLAQSSYLDHIDQIDIFNPALPKTPTHLPHTKVNVHINHSDPVQKTGGYVPISANVIKYQAKHPSDQLSSFLPHIQCYAATNAKDIEKLKGQDYNQQINTLKAKFIYHILRPIGFLLFLPIYLLSLIIQTILRLVRYPFHLFKKPVIPDPSIKEEVGKLPNPHPNKISSHVRTDRTSTPGNNMTKGA